MNLFVCEICRVVLFQYLLYHLRLACNQAKKNVCFQQHVQNLQVLFCFQCFHFIDQKHKCPIFSSVEQEEMHKKMLQIVGKLFFISFSQVSQKQTEIFNLPHKIADVFSLFRCKNHLVVFSVRLFVWFFFLLFWYQFSTLSL